MKNIGQMTYIQENRLRNKEIKQIKKIKKFSIFVYVIKNKNFLSDKNKVRLKAKLMILDQVFKKGPPAYM